MAGSTLARRQDPMAAAVEFGDQLIEAWHSLRSATGSLVNATGTSLVGLVQQPVDVIGPRASKAAAWVNGRLADGIEWMGSTGLPQRTRRVVDESVTLGLKKLGVPTHADYVALAQRMDRLSASVRRLEAETGRKAPRQQAVRRRTR